MIRSRSRVFPIIPDPSGSPGGEPRGPESKGASMSGTTTPTPARRGLDGVVAAQTRLSHVDGQNGVLIIGGYELKELAGKVTFEEAAHLLWSGSLPSAAELTQLRTEMAGMRSIPDIAVTVLRAAKGAPPIDAL